MFACHWFIGSSPILHECWVDPEPGQTLPAPAAPSLTGVDRPSTSMSFHWSNIVILHMPSGRPVSVKVPSDLHLVNAKSSPSASPTLTKHCVKAKLLLSPLPYSRSSGVRLMRSVVTSPVTVFVQLRALTLTFGSWPAQTAARRELMMAGLAKPIDTWYPAGPYSWKKFGSPTRRNESWAFWPSSVLVCSHSSPRAMRSAPAVATTP